MSDIVLFLQEKRKPRPETYVLADRGNPLHLSDKQFISKYRLNKESFLYVCDILQADLCRGTNGYSVELQVLSVLRLLGSGSFQNVIVDEHFLQMCQSTISVNLASVCEAVLKILPDYISFPMTDAEQAEVRRGFYTQYGFPCVAGVVDGTHIPIERPFVEDWFVYLNRKSKFTINVQIICDSNVKILDIIARWPGSCHDSHMWNLSGARQVMESQRSPNSNFLIGDSGYPLEPWLLKPYVDPASAEETLFNNRLRSVRSTIERCNGVLKSRFRCLHQTGGCLAYAPDKVCQIILVCAVLHNICVQRNVPLPEDEEELEDDDPEVDEPAYQGRGAHRLRLEGNAIRKRIAEFLINA